MVEYQVNEVLAQRAAPVRFEWGPTGAQALGETGGCLIVVDVLSFTTAVSVAVGRGMAILPYQFEKRGAEAFAAASGAELAVRRREVTAEHPWSLSPVALSRAPVASRLVLPSPNGSAISAAAPGPVVAACLRNASAVVPWVLEQGYGVEGRPIVVVAAGERWPDGSLRPALEDGLGAGAVLSMLRSECLDLSSESMAMAAMYEATTDISGAIWGCASALELSSTGYAGDVEASLEIDSDKHVPVLADGAFTVA